MVSFVESGGYIVLLVKGGTEADLEKRQGRSLQLTVDSKQ